VFKNSRQFIRRFAWCIVQYPLLCLVTAEIILWFVRYPVVGPLPDNFPGAIEADPVRGWRHKPGVYDFTDENQRMFRQTIWSDNTRATRESDQHEGQELLFLGCSFVQGFGLNDSETFNWLLQTMVPNLSIKNLGTGGYGTLHSLLFEQEYLAAHHEPAPRAVIYGFADFHIYRNIKNPLQQRYSLRPGSFPYCETPSKCSMWSGEPASFLLSHSRFAALWHNAFGAFSLYSQRDLAEEIARNEVVKMKEVAEQYGATFLVAPVSLSDDHWIGEFNKMGVKVVMCERPELHEPIFRMADGHPNALWNRQFAECLNKKLRLER